MKIRTMSQRLHDMLLSYMANTGMMLGALPLVADKIDDIPEPQRTLYVEKEGKFHLDVEGGEDTAGLKSALQKERDAAKESKRILTELQTRFSGIDPDKVKAMMKRLESDGEAALIAEGKIDEVINKRSEKLKEELEKQVKQAAIETAAANKRADKFSQRVLDNHIRMAATKAGLHQHAIEDALFRARSMFSLNEEGDAVQVAADGTTVFGKDGKTPFSPAEWLEGMKETAPHWFPAGSSGGGANGGNRGGKGGKDLSHLPPAARMAAAREQGAGARK